MILPSYGTDCKQNDRACGRSSATKDTDDIFHTTPNKRHARTDVCTSSPTLPPSSTRGDDRAQAGEAHLASLTPTLLKKQPQILSSLLSPPSPSSPSAPPPTLSHLVAFLLPDSTPQSQIFKKRGGYPYTLNGHTRQTRGREAAPFASSLIHTRHPPEHNA